MAVGTGVAEGRRSPLPAPGAWRTPTRSTSVVLCPGTLSQDVALGGGGASSGSRPASPPSSPHRKHSTSSTTNATSTVSQVLLLVPAWPGVGPAWPGRIPIRVVVSAP